jgi:hypothetical protein
MWPVSGSKWSSSTISSTHSALCQDNRTSLLSADSSSPSWGLLIDIKDTGFVFTLVVFGNLPPNEDLTSVKMLERSGFRIRLTITFKRAYCFAGFQSVWHKLSFAKAPLGEMVSDELSLKQTWCINDLERNFNALACCHDSRNFFSSLT